MVMLDLVLLLLHLLLEEDEPTLENVSPRLDPHG